MVVITSWRLRGVVLAAAVVLASCASTVSGAHSATEIVDQHGQPVAVEEEVVSEEGADSDEAAQAQIEAVEENDDAAAGLVLVSAQELEAALAGNTIIGNWVGENYRQFFDENGFTTYRPIETGRDSTGEWRVNVDTGLYESLWNDRGPWEEYEVHRDGDTWFWTGEGVELSEFTIVEGNQLDG